MPILRKSERFRRLRRKLNESKYHAEIASSPVSQRIDNLLEQLHAANPHQHEFLQAFFDLAQNLRPAIARQPQLFPALEILKEPERLIEFNITWTNEYGDKMTNKGWRCEYSSVLGPCKGGLRLHPTCSEATMKFLGLEQTIQNALLNMPMGGGKSGSDFDARNASDHDVRSFAASLVMELQRVASPSNPFDLSGDLGCGPRETAFISAAQKTLSNTSIPQSLAGGKPWATGMGAVEFAKRLLKLPSFDKKKCIISGCGDAALSVARNLIAEGAKVLTLSDSGGYVFVSDGMTFAQWQRIADLKKQRMRLHEMVQDDGWLKGLQYRPGSVWHLEATSDYAFPSATQNEITEAVAERLARTNKIKALVEVANMPCTIEGAEVLEDARVKKVPYKACNIGAMVAIGLNLAEHTPIQEFEHRVRVYVGFVHDQVQVVYDDFYPDLKFPAAVDICGFMRLARALYDQGQFS